MRISKKIVSVLLVCMFLFQGIPGTKILLVTDSRAASDYEAKYQAFINDSRWKSGIAWGDSQGPKLSGWSSSGCCAYCADFEKYMYGTQGWQGTPFYSVSEIRAGDILNVSPQHWIAVLNRSGNTLYTAEGNFDKSVVISQRYSISGSVIYNSYAKRNYSLVKGYHFVKDDPIGTPTISKNQLWYDLKDTITVTVNAANATNYYCSLFKDDIKIFEGNVDGGVLSWAAKDFGIGRYSLYFSCYNSKYSVDSSWENFKVVGSASYTGISSSKENYSINDDVILSVATVCAKGQVVGIDKKNQDGTWNRVVTKDVPAEYKFKASSLGSGMYSAYFSVYNGSGAVDTKRVNFVIGIVNPTAVPTAKPTLKPTNKPAIVPTYTPAIAPTATPIDTPTIKPEETIIPTVSPGNKPKVSATATPTVVSTIKPTTTPLNSNVTPKPSVISSSVRQTDGLIEDSRIIEVPMKQLSVSSVKCKKNGRIITGKVSTRGASVKIKVGKKGYRKATVKGSTFKIIFSNKFKKGTKIIIVAAKRNYIGIKKTYKIK